MHPALSAFIERFEKEARKAGSYRAKIGTAEYTFLEKVWGPLFQFNFDGLHAEYPFKDAKGGERFIDFMYDRGGIRLIIEIDGYTTHARNISPGEFEDHLDRQNDLMLAGWFLLRFSSRQVEQQSDYCRSKIMQALGNRWVHAFGGAMVHNAKDLWEQRRHAIIQLASRLDGVVRAIDIAREFKVDPRVAQKWMKRYAEQGWFQAIGTAARTNAYRITHNHFTGTGGK